MIREVRITAPNHTSAVRHLDSPVTAQIILHACGGGFREEQVTQAIQARQQLWDGKEVEIGLWRFEPIKEGDK